MNGVLLPEFPSVREDVDTRLNEFMRRRHTAHLGAMSSIPRMRIFEGSSQRMVHGDGRVVESGHQLVADEVRFHIDELRSMDLARVLDVLDRMARNMARQQATSMYEAIGDAAESVGNTIDGGGEPMSVDLYLTMLETIEFSFTPDGDPILPEIHGSPGSFDSLAEQLSEPDVQRRLEQLIVRKKEQWRDREASRRLVG